MSNIHTASGLCKLRIVSIGKVKCFNCFKSYRIHSQMTNLSFLFQIFFKKQISKANPKFYTTLWLFFNLYIYIYINVLKYLRHWNIQFMFDLSTCFFLSNTAYVPFVRKAKINWHISFSLASCASTELASVCTNWREWQCKCYAN